MSIGLVLEGGAMRGLYTAGVIDVFLENNIEVDGVIGVSAGVLFGVNYLSKQNGRVLRYNKKFVKDKRYMGIWSLITTGNIVSKDFSFYEIPYKLDVFDDEEYKKSKTKMYATVTNVETGKPEYMKLDSVFEQMEILRATSAMPFVSKFVELDGNKYLDGGISDSIPVEKCKEMGYDKIIVVLTRPIEYRKKKESEGLINMFYKKYPNLAETLKNRHTNYNSSVEKIIDLENKKEIFVIRPSKTLKIKRIEKNTDKLQAMYDLGVEDCKNKLEELMMYLKK
ncbi:MAG: patatin-like phospholipase family protein [Clostridia bacterium]|nr:patatin-like phospholipase family protein [Clostridia bacterium]